MAHLTESERNTLNAAMDIILAHTPPNASWVFNPNCWHGSSDVGITTYFTSSHAQHSFLSGNTFAEHIEDGIAHEVHEDGNAEAVNAARIEKLRAELAKLTGEVV